jgi:hypothetical protein
VKGKLMLNKEHHHERHINWWWYSSMHSSLDTGIFEILVHLTKHVVFMFNTNQNTPWGRCVHSEARFKCHQAIFCNRILNVRSLHWLELNEHKLGNIFQFMPILSISGRKTPFITAVISLNFLSQLCNKSWLSIWRRIIHVIERVASL